MRAVSMFVVFAATMVVASGAVACGSFGSDGNGPVEPDASTARDQDSPPATDATVPAVASFSKLAGLKLDRPPNTQRGDLLVLIAAETESGPADWSAFSASVTTMGHCSNPNKDYIQYATRIDDGTASYTVGDAGARTNVDALLVAVSNARLPEDSALTDQNGTNTGSAAAVSVMHEIDLVLVAFASSPGGTAGRPGDGGLTLVTGGAIELYQGLFPRGRTSTFGPFRDDTPCWGTLTLAIPPP